MKQALRNLIADGKTARAIEALRALNLSDTDLNIEINLLSARFATYERQKNRGIADESDLGIELNKINLALLAVVDHLDEKKTDPSVSNANRVGGCRLFRQPSSHTTEHTVRYSAVH